MKKILFLTLAIVLISCHQKATQNETESHDQHADSTALDQNSSETDTAALYACPMHPEVQGKKDDECSKCGMKLTEPVLK